MRLNTVKGAVAASALVVVGVVAGFAQPTAAATNSSPWSQTDANAAASRSNPSESVLTPSTITHAHYLRSVTASPSQPGDFFGCSTGFITTPILAGGSVYAVVSGRLTKINAKTGAVIWRRTPDPFFTTEYLSLAISSTGLVVLAGLDCTSQSDPVGTLQAFHASNGTQAWRANMPNDGPLDNMVLSQGFVVAAGTSVGGGRVVAAFNVANGTTVWGISDDPNCFVTGDMLVVAGRVVFPTCTPTDQSRLVARALATGHPMWKRSGAWEVVAADSDKASLGHHLYAIDPNGIVDDLNPTTGATRFPLTNAVRPLAVDLGSRVYATCGAHGRRVCAYATGTGAIQWNKAAGTGVAPAASARGLLYLADGAVLRSSTGAQVKQLWDNSTATNLAVGDGRVAVINDPRILDLYGLPGY